MNITERITNAIPTGENHAIPLSAAETLLEKWSEGIE